MGVSGYRAPLSSVYYIYGEGSQKFGDCPETLNPKSKTLLPYHVLDLAIGPLPFGLEFAELSKGLYLPH